MSACWTSPIIRLLAILILLAGDFGVPKVLCVAPSGHQAVEDALDLCCAGTDDDPGGFTAPTRCQGCTDILLTTAITAARTHSSAWFRIAAGQFALPAAASSWEFDLAAAYWLCDRQPESPQSSPPQASILRC